MSAHGRSEALVTKRIAEGSPMSAHGRSEALITKRVAPRGAQ
jgi:hypothetical protein